MLSLCTKGVLIGLAWVCALAARGERGMSHVLELMSVEMKVAMTLTGRTRAAAIGSET
jgi:L-lactate dehydrogenase (cytochrome)